MSKSFLSISTKIISLVLIMSVVSIAITTGLAFTLIDSILKSQVQKTLEDESLERGIAISNIIESRIDKLEELSKNQEIQIVVNKLGTGIDEVTFSTLLEEHKEPIANEIRLFQLNDFQAGLSDLKIVNMIGNQIYSLNDEIKTPNVSELKLDAHKVEFLQDQNKNRLMKLSIPVQSSAGTQLGAIIAITPTSVFDSILSSRFNLQETGEVYLVNTKKIMISDSIFFEDAAFKQRVNTLPVTECFENNQSMTGTVYTDYRDVDIFGVSYCQNELGFVLLTEVDESVVQQPILDLQEKILIAGLAIMIAAAVVSFILSKKLSKPILQLRDVAEQVSQGNFVKSGIKTNDEIGLLSSSFDTMTSTINETLSAITRREDVIHKQNDMLMHFSESQKECCICLIDMVGAKKIMSTLSKDQVEKYIGIFTDSVIPIIKKYDGISVKILNDALLFYFNKENNSSVFSNAVNCCLDICEQNEIINEKLSVENLPGMAYRISATFGQVNETSSESNMKDIFGEPVNHCFKINQYALPNSLVIGDTLYENVKDKEFSFTHLNKSIVAELDYDLYIVSRK